MMEERDRQKNLSPRKFMNGRLKSGLIFWMVWLLAGVVWAQEKELKVGLKFLTYGYSNELPFSSPQGIFYDRRFKEIYVCDAGNHQVVICDSTGFPVYRFKHWVARSGQRFLGEPRSLAVNSEGDIFLVDNLAEYIDVLNHRGEEEYKIRLDSLLGLPAAKPTCLALDAEENLYVGYRNQKCELAALDRDGKIIRRLENGPENHQDFGEIAGIWVDSNIYIVDALDAPSVRVFSKDGVYLSGFGKHEIGWDGFSLPQGVAVTAGGIIWIVDTFREVVKAFTPEGGFIQYLGGYGRDPGAMRYPVAIAGDGERLLVVLESTGARVQEFEIEPEQ